MPDAGLVGGEPPWVQDPLHRARVALHLSKFRPHISGVVLVGVAAIPMRTVEQLADLPVRMVALAGYPGSPSVERMMVYVESLRKAGKQVPDIARLHDRAEPWLFGVSRSRKELTSFATQVFGER